MRPEHYMRGGKLFAYCRGSEMRILSFCLDDPEQGPVVELPLVDAYDWGLVHRVAFAIHRLRGACG